MSKLSNRARGLLMGAPVIALTALAAGPAGAAMTGDAGYMEYHGAVRAAVVCEDVKLHFSEPMVMGATSSSEWLPLWTPDRQAEAELDMSRIEEKILQRVGPVSHDRLSMIEDAKAGADATIREEGCGSAPVQAMLDTFNGDLMPVTTGSR